MAIAQLLKLGYVKHLISQNIDDLHLKSGVPFDQITELHGNVFIEECEKWKTVYRRTFRTRIAEDKTHKTGRKWEQHEWDGDLNDTLVLFGESIPKLKIEKSLQIAQNSRLCIWIGSSLLVKPAISFPFLVKRNKDGRLVVINMEQTPFDRITDVRIGGNWDETMRYLMDELNISVPDYVENNSVKIFNKGEFIEIDPHNVRNSPIQKIEFLSTNEKAEITAEVHPYKFLISPFTDHCQINIHFEQDNKSPLEIEFNLGDLSSNSTEIIAKFNPSKNRWMDFRLVKH
jgi:hypothetical protein